MSIDKKMSKPGEGMIYKQTELISDKCCPVCAALLPEHPAAGRPVFYCKEACKMKAYRQRQKSLRISDEVDKPLRNSRKLQNLLVNSSASGKVIGVSGTVHALPVPAQKSTTTLSEAPVIRSFDDLKAFFCGG